VKEGGGRGILASEFALHLDGIVVSLNRMEKEQKVDLSVVPQIEEAIQLLEDSEREITSGPQEDVGTSFLAYHIIRNVRTALQKMKVRFREAKEKGDNPIVAEDSLAIIPILSESYEMAQRYARGPLSQSEESVVIDRIRILRDAMSSTSMVMSEQEEFEEQARTGLEGEWEVLADAVKSSYVKEQQDTN